MAVRRAASNADWLKHLHNGLNTGPYCPLSKKMVELRISNIPNSDQGLFLKEDAKKIDIYAKIINKITILHCRKIS